MADDDKAVFARCPAFNIECQYVTEVDRLSAENERLREALSRVYKIKPQEPLSQQSEWTEATARAALGETE